MRTLVTGAKGFIGSQLCNELVKAGHSVVRLQRASGNNCVSNTNTTSISVDIAQAAQLQDITKGIDAVFHLAAITHSRGHDSQDLDRVNVLGTKNLMEECLANKVGRFIYFSSSLVNPWLVDKDQGDRTAYGESKLKAEKVVTQDKYQAAIKTTILRPVNVYGPGMKGNIRSMISLIDRSRLPPLPRIENKLSLIGVNDLARAAIMACENENTAGKSYTLTDGISYSTSSIEQAIYTQLGRKYPQWRIPSMILYAAAAIAELANRLRQAKGGIGLATYRNLFSDNEYTDSNFHKDTGFEPINSLQDQLPDIIKQIRSDN